MRILDNGHNLIAFSYINKYEKSIVEYVPNRYIDINVEHLAQCENDYIPALYKLLANNLPLYNYIIQLYNNLKELDKSLSTERGSRLYDKSVLQYIESNNLEFTMHDGRIFARDNNIAQFTI